MNSISTKTLTLKFDLNIAHRLYEEGGKCENIHGHNLDVILNITLKDIDLKEQGFTINFSDIKRTIRENFDHKFVYYIKDDMHEVFKSLPGAMPVDFNPSTENFAERIADITKEIDIKKTITKISVVLHETINNSAEITKSYE